MLKINGKLTYEDAQRMLHMNKREKAKKIHLESCNYAITPPKKEGGRWQTYIKDESFTNGRKKIMKTTEEALLDELVIHYIQK